MTHKKMVLNGTAILICLAALTAPVGAAADGLPTPDTYLHQIGVAPVAEATDGLPTPDTYLNQIGKPIAPVDESPAPVEGPAPQSADGFDWGSAVIGAAAGAGLAALLAGSLALVSLRRRTGEASATVT